MIVIGNIVRQGGDLGFHSSLAGQVEIVPAVVIGNKGSGGVVGAYRTVMFGQSFEGFKTQIKAIEPGIVTFQEGDHAQALGVVIKTAISGHGTVQTAFPGMAKRGVAKIMGQGDGFGEIFIDIE